jgi:hypothetical protein
MMLEEEKEFPLELIPFKTPKCMKEKRKGPKN